MTEMDKYSFSKEDGLGRHTIEHTYMCHEDSTWMPIMLQFAAFLEGCGYVGVYRRVEALVDDDFGDDWK